MTRIHLTSPSTAPSSSLGGLALLAGPFLLGAAPGRAWSPAISLGALLVGMALAGPDSLPISAHQSFDLDAGRGARRRAGSGSPSPAIPRAALVLAVVGALQLTLVTLTRWVRA